MQFYEINILISSKLSLEEAAVFMANLENQFQELGRIVGEGKAEKKLLAYPIKDEGEAWFSFFTFFPKEDGSIKEALDLIDKKLKEEKIVLRHLIIKKEEKKVKFKKRAAERKPEKKPTHLTETEMKKVEEKINELLEEN
ncbi:MAG TPA: 30S ribosomal protein S6 [Candidatus Pacearchaeota archaeon]|nr:30S ribosomal protein S6 [Candidatus Pacearchaeota archaeon]